MTGDRRGPGQRRVLVDGVSGRRLDGRDDGKHGGQIGFGDEHRRAGEEMGAGGQQGRGKIRVLGFRLDRAQQAGAVQGDAEAFLVEREVTISTGNLVINHAGSLSLLSTSIKRDARLSRLLVHATPVVEDATARVNS